MSDHKQHIPAIQKPGLLDQDRAAIKTKHNSLNTKKLYINWIKIFVLFHGNKHPRVISEKEINEFHKTITVFTYILNHGDREYVICKLQVKSTPAY
jgi:desulfoferrodoxin (superoxide reductase-like protein)